MQPLSSETRVRPLASTRKRAQVSKRIIFGIRPPPAEPQSFYDPLPRTPSPFLLSEKHSLGNVQHLKALPVNRRSFSPLHSNIA